jgi:DNA-binding transcriptional regulator GbsR (MarR family)
MSDKSAYAEGHLIVAAIRVHDHLNDSPPDLGEICTCLELSREKVGQLIRRLGKLGIISAVESAYGQRYAITDHLKLEELPRSAEPSKLDEEIQRFKSERSKMEQKVESIKSQQAQKKKDLFAEIEKKLKKNLNKD